MVISGWSLILQFLQNHLVGRCRLDNDGSFTCFTRTINSYYLHNAIYFVLYTVWISEIRTFLLPIAILHVLQLIDQSVSNLHIQFGYILLYLLALNFLYCCTKLLFCGLIYHKLYIHMIIMSLYKLRCCLLRALIMVHS